MARLAPKLDMDKFKNFCSLLLNVGGDEFDPYDFPEQILKDLSKVNFDFENYEIGNADPSFTKYPSDHKGYNNYPVGYEMLPNGLPVLFVNAGGDWESPICFCIYFDGSKMRAYIPSEGNVWNKKEKCAYGSEEDQDTDEDSIHPEGDPEKIKEDIMKRIQIKQ